MLQTRKTKSQTLITERKSILKPNNHKTKKGKKSDFISLFFYRLRLVFDHIAYFFEVIGIISIQIIQYLSNCSSNIIL